MDPVLAETMVSQIVDVLLADNVKTRVLRSDGSYIRRTINAEEMPIQAQRVFLLQSQAL
jgi:polyphosphate kinase